MKSLFLFTLSLLALSQTGKADRLGKDEFERKSENNTRIDLQGDR
ncbi:hypothetical protein PG637_08665 [Riemerella anatipestifer]|nr:hypothetical protein [Riemerella anatipestifer]MDY3325735.1 hypothetical protein [Riemerella anatipestifer]MDY3354277.1 hypothetical protein [Riemerella anatipestifer]